MNTSKTAKKVKTAQITDFFPMENIEKIHSKKIIFKQTTASKTASDSKTTSDSKTDSDSKTASDSKVVNKYYESDDHMGKVVHTYTDGSTVDNGKVTAKGGYGVFFGDNDKKNISEPFFIYPITNNRCELYGCIQSIQIFAKVADPKKKYILVINTDSEYIVNSMTKWLPAWKARGWRKADKKPVENVDLINWLDKLMKLYSGFFKVKFNHVNAAHDYAEPKDKKSLAWQHWYGNNEADKLAKRGTTISIKLDQIDDHTY